MNQTNNQTLQKLKNAFAQDLKEYRSIPFWSWNNTLDPKELVRQIEDMKSAGIGGFIMHARTGLKDEYLGEKWFSCIEVCLDKAKELNMNAWIYDENGWPSGFVGGKLLENHDFLAQFLTYEIKKDFDYSALCVFQKTENGYRRIRSDVDGNAEYHCIYLNYSPANTDILNPDVVDAFIKETHEKYYERFADRFGKELAGFFTDEPQYYRWGISYSMVAEKTYLERYGEDIRDGLIYLFYHDSKGYAFRQRFFRTLNELYIKNFYKKIYDWCSAHNCMLTGHSIEEKTPSMQMIGGAGIMPTYRFEHIPAIDWLGRQCGTEIMGKQIGSVASQFGIKHVLTETFAGAGYDVTPKELKSIAEFQFLNGVNLLCQHLYPYSIAAQGKYDWPPVFSPQGNWFEEFKTFNDYFTHLGYILANTDDVCDVLIIHPLRDAYLEYIRTEGSVSTGDLDRNFEDLLFTLRKKGICYHFADETILEEHGRNEKGHLVIGNCRYHTVLVPKMQTIASTTLKLLQAFEGKLCVLQQPQKIDGIPATVSLLSNTTLEEIQKNATVSFACDDGNTGMTARKSELGDFIFLKNYSLTQSSLVRMHNIAQQYRKLDLETMTLSNISNEMRIGASESVILVRDETASEYTPQVRIQSITSDFFVNNITENYLTLDNISISYDGEKFSETLPLQRHVEDLLRANYRGSLWVKYTFNIVDKIPLKLWIEQGKYISLTLNGHSLTLHDCEFDVYFKEADLTESLKEGENELVYEVNYYQHDGVHYALFDPMSTESLVNCLYYDTHLENVYLKGDFVLDENHSIHQRTEFPPITSRLFAHGYPFFKGTLTLKGAYHYDGNGGRILSLEQGRFLVAHAKINGVDTELTLDTKKDITAFLRKGNNDIEILLKSSLRNLLGPHHFKNRPDYAPTSPRHYTMRCHWKGAIAPDYTPEYIVVPFGIDDIQMISYE